MVGRRIGVDLVALADLARPGLAAARRLNYFDFRKTKEGLRS